MRYRVQVNYKSGQSMVMECDEFNITSSFGTKTYEWDGAVPMPIKFGADDVESVWQLAVIDNEGENISES